MPASNCNIRKLARENRDFRREVLTNAHSQVVLMCVRPGDDIGDETHDVDQILVFVKGEGTTLLGGETGPVKKGSLVAVPAGMRHNVINSGSKPLRLYTIYSPPEHAPGTVHRTRAEAIAAEAVEANQAPCAPGSGMPGAATDLPA